MSREYTYSTQEEFLEKLKSLLDSGANPKALTTVTPFFVHEVEEMLKPPNDRLKFFTLGGAVLGFVLSFAMMIYAVLQWPLITGGKPYISFPAFLIVAFECTILVGGLATFSGFLFLSRLPDIKSVIEPEDHLEPFVIIHDEGEEKQ